MKTKNWYKIAQESDFSDRNIINENIDALKAITVALTKLSKIAFHTQAGTRQVLNEILESNKLSSYPLIQKMISDAASVCMDSPQKVKTLCVLASQELVRRVKGLEKKRDKIINDDMPNRWKGWRE